MTIDLADVRRKTRDQPLDEQSLPPDPMTTLGRWYEDASQAQLAEPNAMIVCTVDPRGQPSARTVLMKYLDTQGPVFFTNYGSRKATEIEGNPKVAALFLWTELERQIQIRGRAEKIGHTESLRYFLRRPRESQIGAWVSRQSSVISSRSLLEAKFEQMKQKFREGDVPLPDFWGGYRIVPTEVEVWQGRAHRLHDRFVYAKDGDAWSVTRLAP